MTTTVDELAMRRESEAIAARRPDVILDRDLCMAMHPSSQSPFAALLFRIARLVRAEDLPPAKVTAAITTTGPELVVDATGVPLVENTVRLWASALELPPVVEAPFDVNGLAATQWSSSAYDGTGVWVHVTGYELVSAVTG